MTNNIQKPPRENGSTSSSTQRSSLWKRLGRRGSNKPTPTPTPSNTTFQQSAPSGSIPLKSSNELYETIPVEPDNGDARSLSTAKRSQRMINNSKNNTKNNTASSKGGSGGGLMRKLKSSFRKSSANSDQNQLQLQQDIDDNDEGTMLPDHQRSPLSSQRPLDPGSPAYSTDSFATVEVGKLCNI